jgi:hypothetical protein
VRASVSGANEKDMTALVPDASIFAAAEQSRALGAAEGTQEEMVLQCGVGLAVEHTPAPAHQT